jgi:hypothetical protein
MEIAVKKWKHARKAGTETGEMWYVCRTLRQNISATADSTNPKPVLFSLGECLLSDGPGVTIANSEEKPGIVEKRVKGRCWNGLKMKYWPNFELDFLNNGMS